MAVFGNAVITALGTALITKAEAGQTLITFTKFATSDTRYTQQQLASLSSLTGVKQNSLVSAVKIVDITTVKASAPFYNTTLQTGYYIRTVGLYANDPDSDEILFAVAVTSDDAHTDFMPPITQNSFGLNVNLSFAVSNSSVVSLTVSPEAVALVSDLLTKADKVISATSGDFAALDANGNLIDSHKSAGDFDPYGTADDAVEEHNASLTAHIELFTSKQVRTQNLTAYATLAEADTIPFFSTVLNANRKVTIKALKAALGVQSAAIAVTTCTGAAVTCTMGSTSYTGTGSTTFNISDYGTWTVTAVLNGSTVTDTVNVTGALQYNVSLMILKSIAITTAPTKTAYNAGEYFSPSGMVVTATYQDNTTAVVANEDLTWSPSGALSSGTTSVTISYALLGITKTAAQAITVSALSSITVTTPPTKTVYLPGEYFSTSGMVITATYTSGSTRTVTGYTYSPTGALTNSNTAITITYTEGSVTKTTTQSITVTATLTSIQITTPPDKTSYFVGDLFVSTGMIVKANYSDGSSNANVTGYTWAPSAALAANNTYVTVSYTAGNITKTVNQAITVVAVSTTFASNSWATIISVANNALAQTYWNVGDSKSFTVNSVSYDAVILDFNKDGSNITFGVGKTGSSASQGVYAAKIELPNGSVTPASPDGAIYQGQSYTGDDGQMTAIYNDIQSDIRAAINLVNKGNYYVVDYQVDESSGTIIYDDSGLSPDPYTAYVWLPSYNEVFGTSLHTDCPEGTQYAFYAAGNSKIRYNSGVAVPWILRSIQDEDGTAESPVSRYGGVYAAGGGTSTSYLEGQQYFTFCFCIGTLAQ